MKRVLLIVALAAVTACAKAPSEIAPIAPPADSYSTLDCDALKSERLKVAQNIETLSAAQASAATQDTVGVLLLGLPLASMSGGDKEALLASEKGKLQAIDGQAVRKAC